MSSSGHHQAWKRYEGVCEDQAGVSQKKAVQMRDDPWRILSLEYTVVKKTLLETSFTLVEEGHQQIRAGSSCQSSPGKFRERTHYLGQRHRSRPHGDVVAGC